MNQVHSVSSKIDKNTLRELFEQARQDNSISNLDVEELLSAVENNKYAYLENKTLYDISKEIVESISELEWVTPEYKVILCKKLAEYRHVDELDQLHLGKYVRWINKEPILKEDASMADCLPNLTLGGILVDIKFEKTGAQLLIKNHFKSFMRCKFDNCIVFQKLYPDEQMLLGCYEIVANLGQN